MSETKEEKLARLRAELGIEVVPESEVDPDSGLTMADRARLTATGLLFNWADEAIAGVKALSPDVTYEEALTDEREKLKSAQSKEGSLKYEIGGAFIPTVAALAATPFTGGTSAAATAPTWMRLLGIGATQGLAMGTGASEEEGLARLKDAPVATATGAIANPLFAKLAQGTQAALSPLIDYTKRQITGKVGKKVEDELIRIIKDSGLSVDDVLDRVSKGEVIPEMSEEAYRVVSGFVKTAGPGSAVIRNAIVGRKNQFVEDLYQSLQKDLAPNTEADNIFATFANNSDKLKASESAAYTKIFESSTGQTFKEIDDVVLALANASRNSRNLINKKLDENGLKPIFKMVGKGKNAKLQLTRSLGLEEGEIIKRAFMDVKNTAQRAGTSDKANTMKGYETTIKNVLDEISPELQATRKNWAMIEDSVKQFETGQKIFSPKTDPEQFAITFQKLVDAGNEDAIAALRAGAASALKRKAKGSQKIGTVNKLANETETRDILEILYPGENLDEIVNKINLASGAARAEAGIFKGSPTAGREGSASRVGQVGQTVADITRVVNSGGMDIGATTNIVTRLFGGKKPPFTDEQFEQIAKLVVSEDSEALRRALTDDTQLDAALQVFRKAINALGASQPRVTALTNVTEGIGDTYDPVVSGALEGIIQTIKPATANKIQQVVQ
jgi:uncharacterized protein YukE